AVSSISFAVISRNNGARRLDGFTEFSESGIGENPIKTGRGMPAEHHAKIFEKFGQLASGTRYSTGWVSRSEIDRCSASRLDRCRECASKGGTDFGLRCRGNQNR